MKDWPVRCLHGNGDALMDLLQLSFLRHIFMVMRHWHPRGRSYYDAFLCGLHRTRSMVEISMTLRLGTLTKKLSASCCLCNVWLALQQLRLRIFEKCL
jgi:hypothetical protein